MAVDVDFDPHVEALVVCPPEFGDRVRGRQAVGDELQVATLPAQRERLAQFRGHHADGVDDVPDPVREKLFGFLECRHRDALRAGRDLGIDDLGAFGGLDVRPEPDAERVQMGLHAADVVLHAADVDQGGRGVEGLKVHDALPRRVADANTVGLWMNFGFNGSLIRH